MVPANQIWTFWNPCFLNWGQFESRQIKAAQWYLFCHFQFGSVVNFALDQLIQSKIHNWSKLKIDICFVITKQISTNTKPVWIICNDQILAAKRCEDWKLAGLMQRNKRRCSQHRIPPQKCAFSSSIQILTKNIYHIPYKNNFPA